MRAQLGGKHIAGITRQRFCGSSIFLPGFSQFAHRGYGGKAVAKALHAPAFMIHRDQQGGGAQCMYLSGESGKLRGRFEIA